MRYFGVIVLAAGLAGCGGGDEVVTELPESGGDRAVQEAACAAAVAAHTGLGLEAMAPEWTGVTDTGTDVVFVRHGSTLHTCEVDAAAQVLELQHPDE
jgi:hypothetical protein